jgi:PIN domain nuclease of toxin-antitoxin system
VRLLLDTHTLLWWLSGNEKMSLPARSAIGDSANAVYVSTVTAWEISTKYRIGKLPSAAPVVGHFGETLKRNKFNELPITLAHAERAESLPGEHRDPFDRMLIAQAILERMRFISLDAKIDAFGVDRLW